MLTRLAGAALLAALVFTQTSGAAQAAGAPQGASVPVPAAAQAVQQLSPPLTVGDGSALLFQAQDGALVLWRMVAADPDRSQRIPLPGLRLDRAADGRPARYASLATRAGLWLVGPTSWLIRPDGRLLSVPLRTSRQDVVAVAQPDGSVLAIGGAAWPDGRDAAAWLRVERLAVDADGVLRSEALDPLPVEAGGQPLAGLRALHLGDGRVLAVGPQQRPFTLVFEPASRRWVQAAPWPDIRHAPSLIRLPDGRVWAAGGTGSPDAPTTSALWDPATRQWQAGPVLPVPMQDHQAQWVADAGVALLGAGHLPVVLGWKPGPTPVVTVAAGDRAHHGALVPLSGRRLGLVADADPAAAVQERPWVQLTGWSLPPAVAGAWQLAQQGGLAVQAGRALAAGGSLVVQRGGGDVLEPSRVLEGLGGMKSFAPLPVAVDRAQVAWLDAGHALMLAERPGLGPVGWLGVLEVATGRWRTLDAQPLGTVMAADGIHGRVHLIGTHAGRAWLVSEQRNMHWLDAQGRLTLGPNQRRQRLDLVGRVLADGRVVVAGGLVEGELVASRPADCPDCASGYVAWAGQEPARRHEIFDPARQDWTLSTPSRAGGTVAAVLADGRVATAGTLPQPAPQRSRALLELSSADGRSWRSLPWPDAEPVPASGEGLRLLAPLGADGGPLPAALFLGVGQADGAVRWWWLPSVDAPSLAWLPLGRATPPFSFLPGEVALDVPGRLVATGSAAGVIVSRRR